MAGGGSAEGRLGLAPDDVCVHDRAGRALRPTQCVACAQGAGLPSSVGLHTLRQSATSVMLSAGLPLKVVSEVFGHANVAMSMPVKLGKVGTGRPRGTAPMVWIPLLARSTTPRIRQPGSSRSTDPENAENARRSRTTSRVPRSPRRESADGRDADGLPPTAADE